MSFLFALLLAAAPCALADDLTVPTSFCEDPLVVSQNTESCPGNGTFIQAAKDCVAKLNALEAKLGAADQALSGTGAASQRAQTATGDGTYAQTVAQLTYLKAIAALGAVELAGYEPYVFLPPDSPALTQSGADPYSEAPNSGCFRDTQAQIATAHQYFLAKGTRYEARRAEAAAYQAQLTQNGTDYGSLQTMVKPANAAPDRAPAAIPRGNSNNPSSTITGVPPVPER